MVARAALAYRGAMIRNLLLSSASLLAFVACTADKPADPKPSEPNPAKSEAPAVADRVVAEATQFDAKCGCSIEGVGHCGNFVKIDGRYVPILHASLGRMEWCAKKDAGAKIEASGEIKDGKFVAKQIKTLD